MKPELFYALVGDLFGVVGPSRPNPHRGVDFPWPAGTDIPAWCAGTVALNEWNGVLGWVLSVRTPTGWAGYSHMLNQAPLKVGAKVKVGQLVGDVGNTGSASRGAHLHATFSHTSGNPGVGAVVDPLPYIKASVQPIPSRKNTNAMTLYHDTSTLVKGKFVDGVTVHALAGDGTGESAWIEDKSLAIANALSVQIGGPSVPLSHAEFEERRALYRGSCLSVSPEAAAQIGAAIAANFPEIIIAGTARPTQLKNGTPQ